MGPLAPGLWGVLATPYAGDDLRVDHGSLGRLARHYEQVGATGLTVLGVFGEAARLSTVERGAVLSSVVGAVGLPLVVGAAHVLQHINDGDVLMIDGGSGQLIVEPDAGDLRAHRMRMREQTRERRQLHRLRREPTRTLDGIDIKLYANAESRE